MHLDTGAPTRRVTQPEVGATRDLWQRAGQPWRGLSLETSTRNRGLRLLEGHPLWLQGGHLLPLGHPLFLGLWRKGGPKICNFLHGPNPEILLPQLPFLNWPSIPLQHEACMMNALKQSKYILSNFTKLIPFVMTKDQSCIAIAIAAACGLPSGHCNQSSKCDQSSSKCSSTELQ